MHNINKIILKTVAHLVPKMSDAFEKAKLEQVDDKPGVSNIVTNVDRELDAIITDFLHEAFPGCCVLSEETAGQEEIIKGSLIFVVDPLDGSVNFINDLPHCVSIGIVDEDELMGGIIYVPHLKRTYVSFKGGGVTYIKDEDLKQKKAGQLANKIIRPAYARSGVKNAPIAFDVPYSTEAYDNILRIMKALYINNGGSLKISGPTALDVLKCALGKENSPDCYNSAVFNTEVRAWDLCAATAIIRELGGDVFDMRTGFPLDVSQLTDPNTTIAYIGSGNNDLLDQMFDICRKVFRDWRK